MKRIVLAVALLAMLSAPALALTLRWDAVTTDEGGFTETISLYRCYQRRFGTTDQFVKFGETPSLTIATPTSAAKMEYAVTAVDAAGNESVLSNLTTAKPNAPGNAVVTKP